jgi:membrane-bound serine protease (ClpP class)
VITPVVLTTAGLLLVVAEVLFPSLGAFGIGAVACIVFADVIAAREVGMGFFWVLVAVQVVAIPLLLKAAFWALPRLPFARGMVLPTPAPEPKTGVEPSDHLLGMRGVALTDLRPSGTAQLGDERRSVVSETSLVPQGTLVRVVAVEGYRVVVRPEP